MSVRITNGALDEFDGRVMLRGVIDPATLDKLQLAEYQREQRPSSSISKIMEGYKTGSAVPDIELGMRGVRKRFADNAYTLLDDVYIIDGQQRVAAAKRFLQEGGTPHLGAVVYFGTDEPWERRQFKILNVDRTRVSSNVIFRNERNDVKVVDVLIKMSEDKDFVLKDRICWDQNKKRGQLIHGLSMGKVICSAHSHLMDVTSLNMDGTELAQRLQKLYDLLGPNVFKGNIRTLYDVIDVCWGLKTIHFADSAPQNRATFQLTFAKALSNHEEFWRANNTMFVEMDYRRKWKSFPIQDPTVLAISSKGTRIDPVLYKMLMDHLNSGKKSKRLKERTILETEVNGDDSEEESAT